MRARVRTTLALLVLAATSLSLSGCDILAPTRDAQGKIVRATVMPTTDARVGDCFTFIDGSNLAYATVVPCTDAHTQLVIGLGKLSVTKIAMAGGLQNAVNVACGKVYDAFLATLTDGAKPAQQFIVSVDKKPGGDVTHYSCIADDSVAVAAG